MTTPTPQDGCVHVLYPSLEYDRGIWFGECAKCHNDIPCNSLGEILPPTPVAESEDTPLKDTDNENH